jgi:hypothetical protein
LKGRVCLKHRSPKDFENVRTHPKVTQPTWTPLSDVISTIELLQLIE